MQWIIAWIAAGAAFGMADFIWLSLMVPRLYRPIIGSLLADKPNVGAMVAFYVIYISGIVFFAIAPALADGGLATAMLHGAALGVVAYATFDFSNQSILRVWTTRLSLVDIAWGAFATALAASAGYLAAARFG